MLQNAYFLAKIGADTAENEQHFAEILIRPSVAQASEIAEVRGQDKASGPQAGLQRDGVRRRQDHGGRGERILRG